MGTAMITYKSSSLSENQKYLDDYIDGIPIPYDDFLEEHILNSAIYSIFFKGEHIGFFGKNEKMLTIFFIRDAYFSKANEVFAEIKTQFDIHEAFVPTTDIGFLSVALEKYESIAIQALHFTATNTIVRPAEFSREHFRAANEHDVQAVEQLAGDFLDKYPERINAQQIYVLEDEGEMIGLGVLIGNIIMRNCVGTGMFTKDSRRGEGVGRSIILHLKAIVQEQGKTPVPGCWYYNTNSRETLESAGYISKSKLLRFQF
jgi:predicted GNAT family acetyltransferase